MEASAGSVVNGGLAASAAHAASAADNPDDVAKQHVGAGSQGKGRHKPPTMGKGQARTKPKGKKAAAAQPSSKEFRALLLLVWSTDFSGGIMLVCNRLCIVLVVTFASQLWEYHVSAMRVARPSIRFSGTLGIAS